MTESIKLYQKFLELKQEKLLPPKVINKLKLLSESITGQKNQFNNQSLFLSQEEIRSFNQIPQQVKKSLFCQIVQSLLSQQLKINIFIQKQVAYLRKNMGESLWVKCLFTLDQIKIILINHKNGANIKQMAIKKLANLQISPIYKGKFQVFFNYKTNPIWMGFDTEYLAAKVVHHLKKIKQQSQHTIQKTKTRSTIQYSEIFSQCNNEKNQQIETQKRQFKRRLLQEESILKQFTIKFVNEQKNQYKLLQIIGKGRLMTTTNKNQKTKFKISLLLQDIPLSVIVQNYMKVKEWNSFIETFQILSKVSENSYNAIIIFKKKNSFNYFEYPKGAVINISGLSFENKIYLIFRCINMEHQFCKTFQNFKFIQVIQISTKQNSSFALINVIFEINEEKISSSDQAWVCQYLKYHLKSLPQFLLSKSIQPEECYMFGRIQDKIFQFRQIFKESFIEQSQQIQKTIVQFQDASQQYSQKSQIFDRKIQDQCQQKNYEMKRKKTIQNFQNKSYEIQDYLMSNKGEDSISQKLIQLIKKKEYEKYYLKYHFVQVPLIELNKFEYSSYNEFFYQNGRFKMTDKKQVVFCDRQAIQKQKDIIVYIIKKAGSAILSGQSIMNMSLPVQIFEPRSTTQRMALTLGSFPKYLVKGGQLTDPIEQLKILIQFLISLTTLMVNVQKAFNPILGQTLQVKIGGIPLYMQQISHHPPITAIYSKTQQFQFSGSFNSYLSLGLNHAVGKTLHLLKVKFFKSSSQFQLKLFDIEASGLIYGNRTVKPTQKCFVYEVNKNLYSQVALGKHKKQPYIKNKNSTQNDFQGGLYLVNNDFKKRFLSTKMKVKFEGIKQSDIVQNYGHIRGIWFGDMYINDEKVRDLSNPMPNKLQFSNYVLPSDSNLREDVIYRKLGKIKESNSEKERLQNIQRRDKKLRQGKKV